MFKSTIRQDNAHRKAAPGKLVEEDVKELLNELLEYFDQRADAEYHPGIASPYPNDEMKYYQRVRSILKSLDPQFD